MACRLILVDDHPALTRGLAALLSQEPDLVVSGQFANGADLLGFLEAAPPLPADLVLLDLRLPPPHDGLRLLPRLRRTWPALKVLVFSSASSPTLVAQVAAAGAHGFLDKSVEATALLAAIRAVWAGQLAFPARRRGLGRPLPPAPAAEPGHQAADTLLRLHQLSGPRARDNWAGARRPFNPRHCRPPVAGRVYGGHAPPQHHAKAGGARRGHARALCPRAWAMKPKV